MLVKLVYFRARGKYYSDGEYETDKDYLFEIWQEVAEMRQNGKLPGLVDGAREFIISVDVPEHEHRHPHLIMLDSEQ